MVNVEISVIGYRWLLWFTVYGISMVIGVWKATYTCRAEPSKRPSTIDNTAADLAKPTKDIGLYQIWAIEYATEIISRTTLFSKTFILIYVYVYIYIHMYVYIYISPSIKWARMDPWFQVSRTPLWFICLPIFQSKYCSCIIMNILLLFPDIWISTWYYIKWYKVT